MEYSENHKKKSEMFTVLLEEKYLKIKQMRPAKACKVTAALQQG
jgi:hypothetical protein